MSNIESDKITIESIPNMPQITEGDDIGHIVVEKARESGFEFSEKDIVCVASKAVSMAEGRILKLSEVEVSDLALKIHKDLSRKDPRVIQVIIDQTRSDDGSRLDLDTNYIAGWLPNGMRLTSSGVDKLGSEEVVLIPEDANKSAKKIGHTILSCIGVKVGVIITDSDGRVEKAGSTQIAIGLYGVPALRTTESIDVDGNKKQSIETTCDLLAGSAALLMGQRGTNKPVVAIKNFDYEFDEDSVIEDSLSRRF